MSYFIHPSALSHFILHVSLRYQHSANDGGDESHEIILSFIAELKETTGRIISKLLHKQGGKIRLQDNVVLSQIRFSRNNLNRPVAVGSNYRFHDLLQTKRKRSLNR